ncbi:MAG: response regulator [Nocardioidaceae bacterium]
MTHSPVRVLLADDNAVLRMGLRSLLDASAAIDVVAEAADGAEAIALAHEHRPEVAVLDIRMPGTDGIAAAAGMPKGTRVLMLTYTDEPDVIRAALSCGATGYLVHGAHDPEEIVAAVLSAARGTAVFGPAAWSTLLATTTGATQGPVDAAESAVAGLQHDLTEREVEIMDLISSGLTNRQIAATCFLAEKTVKNHVNRIFAKLAVGNRAEAVSTWLKPQGPPGPSRDLGPRVGPGAHDKRRPSA